MNILFGIIICKIFISAFADFHPFFIGQKHKRKTEICLELFPDYIRHCARNLHILIKKDKFCANYSASCFGQQINGFVEAVKKQKHEEIPSEEIGEDKATKNEEQMDNENEEEEKHSSTTIMPNLNGTNTTNNLGEPDELPPLDFSLRRPPPSPSQRLGRQYNANFCCRFRQRFDCLCRQDHQNIGSYGAAFCPTYSERCGLPLPDWKKNKFVDGQNCCEKSTNNKQERIILTCKQIKLTC